VAFSQAQYQAAVDAINSGMSDLSGRIERVMPAAGAGTDHWYVPDFVKDAVMWLAEEVATMATSLWHTIAELLKGAAAPVLFFFDAYEWQSVRGLANGVAGELSPTVMPSAQHWTGAAEQAYAAIIPPQATAASRIGAISDSTATALTVCAVAGLAFYLTLGVILAQFAIAMIGVIAALGSVAFSWAGVALAVGEVSGISALITGAVVTLLGVLTAQSEGIVSLHGQTVDNDAFPGGRWPDPNTGSYNQAS
jgi:hypothetical protein